MINKWKRLVYPALIFVLLFSLSACGNTRNGTTEESPVHVSEQSSTNEETNSMSDGSGISSQPANQSSKDSITDVKDVNETPKSRILVIYFSRTGEQYTVGVIDHGNTAIVAEMIAEKTGADLFEILPEEDHYPKTYKELTDVAKKEQNDKARPAYAGDLPDLSNYDTVFIGAPVWWGDWPMIMYTFFEKNADVLAGKTLVPFATHEGSGLSGFDRKLAAVCPKAAVAKGLAATGTECQKDRESVRVKIDGWLADLGVRESLASAASRNTESSVGDDDADDDDDD